MKTLYQVHPKETLYLFLQVAISSLVYVGYFTRYVRQWGWVVGSIAFTSFVCYLLFIFWLSTCVLAGMVKGHAVKASSQQFKELFDMVETQSEVLGFKKAPKVYVLQKGGMINAFAARYLRRYYVVLLAPVVAEAYRDGEETLRFIVGHELGHIQRNHLGIWKFLLTAPSKFVPFLSKAYTRACEYTCDRIGYAMAPKGAIAGMGLLSVGPELYQKIDTDAWISDSEEELGFATWLVEIFSTHPLTIKRVKALKSLQERDA